jgi:hypothetical protein
MKSCYYAHMKTKKPIEKRIAAIKQDLLALGDMHPGSLSKQYGVCGKKNCRCKDPEKPQKHGPYNQLSYVHKGKSSSRFIKPEMLSEMQIQVDNYKKFKALTTEWAGLAADLAKLKYLDPRKTKIAQEKN